MIRTRQNGFTLIELMIVVAIIGILSTIGYSSYKDSIVKTNRAQAKVALEGLAGAMERYYSENNSYKDAGFTSAGGAIPLSNKVPKDGTNKYYVLTIVSAAAQTYSLKATAQTNTPQAGDGDLTLTSTGVRKWGSQDSWKD